MINSKKFLIAFLVLLCYSCMQKKEAPIEDSIDTVVVDSAIVEADTTPASDTTMVQVDSSIIIAPPPPVQIDSITIGSPVSKFKGNIISYCPEKMIEDTPNIVSITISKKELEAAIKDVEEKVEINNTAINVNPEKDFETLPVTISKMMAVKLFCDEGDFVVLTHPENTEQEFDGSNDMVWDWTVIPKKVKTLHLTFTITAYNSINDKWVEAGSPIILNTTVKIDPRSYFSQLWSFFKGKPEWLFTQLLFPVVGYYVGRRKSRIVQSDNV